MAKTHDIHAKSFKMPCMHATMYRKSPSKFVYFFSSFSSVATLLPLSLYFVPFFDCLPNKIMTGVKTVNVDRKQSRVTVTGYAEPNKVLNKVKSTGKKKAEFWPYIPYNLVPYPYVAQAYDKKAPSGFVKNVVQALPDPNATDEKLTSLFSDENPHACSIM